MFILESWLAGAKFYECFDYYNPTAGIFSSYEADTTAPAVVTTIGNVTTVPGRKELAGKFDIAATGQVGM